MHPLSRTAMRLFITTLVLWSLAAVVYGTLRLTFGERPVYIHVRWADSVGSAGRQELERRYSLERGELREGRTWGYALRDLSRDNIRRLVEDRAVEDTHQIHRTAFRVGYLAPRMPYPTSRPWVPVLLEILTLVFLLTGLTSAGLAVLTQAAPQAVRGPLVPLRDAFLNPQATARHIVIGFLAWIRTRIPHASAESAGAFRAVFGAALLAIVLRRPVGESWTTGQTNALSGVHERLLDLFREVPWLADWIPTWIAVWGLLFIAGAFTRMSFALTTAGVFAWAVLYTTRITYHTVCALLVTLLCLQWARWGDAWSVDARFRRRGVPRAARQEYGYATWMPGLVLGVVLAAAAFAKLRESGLAWILNGTVKYHFLSDSRQAMVDWGLQLGRYQSVAVFLSFGAIAIESLVIAGALSRRYLYRLLAGAAALALLSGFALLQGLFWPGWWILLLSFLPWHLIGSGSGAESVQGSGDTIAGRLLRPAPVALVVALLAVQLVVSSLKIEVSPLLSTYDMYSTTYASPAEYERKAADEYWAVATDDAHKVHECRISRVEAEGISASGANGEAGDVAADVVRRCFEPSIRIREIAVEGNRVQVDWARWQPGESTRVRLTGAIPITR